MSDPNGWVTNPPATMVKVMNTSREALNGKLGIVLAYQSDRGRYVIAMAMSQEQVSLKPDNLVKGSWMEQVQAQYQFMRYNPQVQQQLRAFYRQVQQRTGTKPEYVAAAIGVVLLVCIYVFGFSRTMLVVSFTMLVALVLQPDWSSGRSTRDVLHNAPMRFKNMIRQNIPMVGHRIADSNILSGLVFAVIVFFFINALVGGAGSTNRAIPVPPQSGGGGGATPAYVPTKPTMDRALLEEYYEKGFQDGQAGSEFGTSLPKVDPPKGVASDPDFGWPGSDYIPSRPPPQSSSSMISKLTNWSSMISMYVVGSTLYNAGRTADGGFDPQLMVANVRMLDVWKQGMLALSVYRLVSSLFTS